MKYDFFQRMFMGLFFGAGIIFSIMSFFGIKLLGIDVNAYLDLGVIKIKAGFVYVLIPLIALISGFILGTVTDKIILNIFGESGYESVFGFFIILFAILFGLLGGFIGWILFSNILVKIIAMIIGFLIGAFIGGSMAAGKN